MLLINPSYNKEVTAKPARGSYLPFYKQKIAYGYIPFVLDSSQNRAFTRPAFCCAHFLKQTYCCFSNYVTRQCKQILISVQVSDKRQAGMEVAYYKSLNPTLACYGRANTIHYFHQCQLPENEDMQIEGDLLSRDVPLSPL